MDRKVSSQFHRMYRPVILLLGSNTRQLRTFVPRNTRYYSLLDALKNIVQTLAKVSTIFTSLPRTRRNSTDLLFPEARDTVVFGTRSKSVSDNFVSFSPRNFPFSEAHSPILHPFRSTMDLLSSNTRKHESSFHEALDIVPRYFPRGWGNSESFEDRFVDRVRSKKTHNSTLWYSIPFVIPWA